MIHADEGKTGVEPRKQEEVTVTPIVLQLFLVETAFQVQHTRDPKFPCFN